MRRGLVAGISALSLCAVGVVGADPAVAEQESLTVGYVLATADTINSPYPLTLGQAADVLRHESENHPAAFACVSPVFLQSAANGLYSSAELWYTGADYAMVRARATAIGPWELYTVCRDESTSHSIFISNANGLAVSTELWYTGADYAMLRARAAVIGPWERYWLAETGTGTTAILSAETGLAVSTELWYTGADYAMLRARAAAIGPWEEYF